MKSESAPSPKETDFAKHGNAAKPLSFHPLHVETTVAALLEHARKATAASKGRKGVALGSSHGSKGLQYDHVYVTNVAEGSYPHKNADTVDEEARLLYVACSRAAKRLWVSWSGRPSRFLYGVAEPEGAENLLGKRS